MPIQSSAMEMNLFPGNMKADVMIGYSLITANAFRDKLYDQCREIK